MSKSSNKTNVIAIIVTSIVVFGCSIFVSIYTSLLNNKYWFDLIFPVGVMSVILGALFIFKGVAWPLVLLIQFVGKLSVVLLVPGAGLSPIKVIKETIRLWKSKRAKDDSSPLPGILLIILGICLIVYYLNSPVRHYFLS